MPNENSQQTEPQSTEPQTEPKKGEGAQVGGEGDQKPAAGSQGAGEGEVTDRHGQPGVNREKYNRDLKAKQDEIDELRAQLDEKSKTEEGRAKLKQQLDEMSAKFEAEKVKHKLEMAGCLNAKAAQALLDDYDGDVEKLKEACPYLFSDGKQKQTGSTGLKPDGDAEKASEEKVDKILSKYKR